MIKHFFKGTVSRASSLYFVIVGHNDAKATNLTQIASNCVWHSNVTRNIVFYGSKLPSRLLKNDQVKPLKNLNRMSPFHKHHAVQVRK